MKATIKSKKWYGRFWPPERRKIRIMQAILDHQTPAIEKKVEQAWRNHLIYGKPLFTSTADCNKSYVKGGRVYDCTCGECF